MISMKRIYLDYAALTPVDKRVSKEMLKYSGIEYGNPSAIHEEGVLAKKAVAVARAKVAHFFHAHSDEIVFTASGTEANNLAIFGAFQHLVLSKVLGGMGKNPHELHMVVSEIEHPSVMETVAHLVALGVMVDYVSIDEKGLVDVQELKEKIRPNTFMVSIMYVNNEIGTIQPMYEVAKIVRRAKKDVQVLDEDGVYPYFHCDASQAIAYLPVNVENFGADIITVDSHKVYGPRGLGALWVRRGVMVAPLIYGGKQEKGLRSGTENLPAIAGFAKALELLEHTREKEAMRVGELRDFFIAELMRWWPNTIVNGDMFERVANNVSVSFPGKDHEFLLLQLDAKGVSCATKSSCLKDADESYVIAALRRAQKKSGQVHDAPHALRFSLGRETQKKNILQTLAILKKLL